MTTVTKQGTWTEALLFAAAIPLLVIALGISLAVPASAAPIVINFETLPSLPVQPNTFTAAGAMQTYTSPGIFSITGGVVLGNPLGLAGFSAHGSLPNAYGTSDLGDPSLLSNLTLTMPASELVTNVTGILFNGQPLTETYTVMARSGPTIVDSKVLSNIPASNSTSDWANFSLSSSLALPISEIDFNTPSDVALNGWDFFVDTLTLTSVPEPSTLSTIILGLTALGLTARRKH
jgi:PEP-CTERM motif